MVLLLAVPMLNVFLRSIIPNKYAIEFGIIAPAVESSAAGICLVLALINWNGAFLIVALALGIAGFVPAFFTEFFTAPTYTKEEIMKMQPEAKKQEDKDASVVGRAIVGALSQVVRELLSAQQVLLIKIIRRIVKKNKK